MRLIDADRLKRVLIAFFTGSHSELPHISKVIDFLDNADTIDAAPVVHGEWEVVVWAEPDYRSYGTIKKPNGAIRCKNCCHAFRKELLWEANYCPNCGAKMDEVSE